MALHKLSLYVLKAAYKEFQKRVGQWLRPKVRKPKFVLEAARKQEGEFTLALR